MMAALSFFSTLCWKLLFCVLQCFSFHQCVFHVTDLSQFFSLQTSIKYCVWKQVCVGDNPLHDGLLTPSHLQSSAGAVGYITTGFFSYLPPPPSHHLFLFSLSILAIPSFLNAIAPLFSSKPPPFFLSSLLHKTHGSACCYVLTDLVHFFLSVIFEFIWNTMSNIRYET